MEPCTNMPTVHYVITAVGNVINMVLLTWLVNRRSKADRREKNGNDDMDQSRECPLDQRKIDGSR